MFDVGIVGGGPSGAWTACLLSRRGRRVALFDGSHPREKPCGGGLTARALALLGSTLPPDAYPSVAITRARFLDVGRGVDCSVPLPTDMSATLVVASRRQFDQRLLQAAYAAGATPITSRVTRIEHAGDGFRLVTRDGEYRCRHLVGADGANSLVRRTFDTPLGRDQLSVATGFYVHGVTSTDILLELTSDPQGYLWSFPRPDHLAVGICAQGDAGATVAHLRDRAAEWIHTTGIGEGGRLEPYSWPIPSLTPSVLRRARFGGPGWLLVGDAAGLVDPITREGIFFALQSATFAADALTADAAVNAGADAAVHRRYAATLRAHVVPELVRAGELKAGFFQPRFTRLVVDALQQSARVRLVMADLIAGTQPYRGLERRLLATFELRLAWRLLNARWQSSHRGRGPVLQAD